ncbi:MAG: Lcl domain-containing protein [Sulfuricella sp.]
MTGPPQTAWHAGPHWAVHSTPSNWFWSASPYVGNSGYAWGVYFGNGYVSVSYRYGTDYVWLVRAGQ